MFTAPYGDAYLEFGANWIHGGSDENELFRLARRNSLLSAEPATEDRVTGLFYTSQGDPIDAELGARCYELFFEAELNASLLYRDNHLLKNRLQHKSLQQFLEEEWNRVAGIEFGPAEDPRRRLADAVFRSMVLYFRSHVGDDLTLVPATLHGTFENVAGEDVKMPNGMRALVDHLYGRLPAGPYT